MSKGREGKVQALQASSLTNQLDVADTCWEEECWGGLSGKVAVLDEGMNGRQLSGAQKGLAARPVLAASRFPDCLRLSLAWSDGVDRRTLATAHASPAY